MMDKYILRGIEAVPCESLTEWAQFMGKKHQRMVKQTQCGALHISTVFLGIDHGWGNSPPLLFETMVFGRNNDAEEIQERCSTWDEALAQHARVCEDVEKSRNWTLFALRNLFR